MSLGLGLGWPSWSIWFVFYFKFLIITYYFLIMKNISFSIMKNIYRIVVYRKKNSY